MQSKETKSERWDKYKKYYEKNKDKISKRRKKYYEENKDKILARGKKWREKNKDKISARQKQYREKNKDKEFERGKKYYEKNKDKLKKYYEENRDERLKYNKKYREENKDKLSKYGKKRYKENRDKILKHAKKYYEKMSKTNPAFRLNKSMRDGMYRSLKNGKGKGGNHWKDLVDYTFEELQQHLESKFDSYMTWENYGSYWHVDHIIPLDSFTFQSAEDPQFKLAWALSNLQPLESSENIGKGNRFDHPSNKKFKPILKVLINNAA